MYGSMLSDGGRTRYGSSRVQDAMGSSVNTWKGSPDTWRSHLSDAHEPAAVLYAPVGNALCCTQELQPSKDSDDEGTDDGKQRDKKRKEVSSTWRTA